MGNTQSSGAANHEGLSRFTGSLALAELSRVVQLLSSTWKPAKLNSSYLEAVLGVAKCFRCIATVNA